MEYLSFKLCYYCQKISSRSKIEDYGGAMMQPVTTHRSLKEKQRQEREELILKAAEEVFMEKGYYETSIDEIAASVGIAKGTVYLHFPSKEDLVIAIFQHDMEKLLQLIKATIASSL